MKETKRCSVCKTEKPLHYFGIDNSRVDGINGRCKECQNTAAKRIRLNKDLGRTKRQLRPVAINKNEHWCTTCRTVHPKDEFNKSSYNASGLNNSCKRSNSEAYKKSRKNLLRTKSAFYKHSCKMKAMKQNYKITEAQFQDLMNRQKGVCKICDKDFGDLKKSAFVDHDHTTGDVRGLLCQQCNSLLGYAADDTKVLLKAVAYLDNTLHNLKSVAI